MEFTAIIANYNSLYSNWEKSPEEHVEFKVYWGFKTLLDLLEGFESGSRNVLKVYDLDEILSKLETVKSEVENAKENLAELSDSDN